jgi:hypothetical protein
MQKNERDLRELVFGDELARTPEAELQAISEHPERQEELNRLLQLREALLTLADEEPPRRTVLVAPATERMPWWRSQLGFGAPGWGFAGAMALAAAILAHGWLMRPVNPVLQVASNPAGSGAPTATGTITLSDAQIEARVNAAVEQRLGSLLQQVRAELKTEHQREAQRLVAAAEERLQQQHDAEMFQMREAVTFIQKKYGRQMVANVAFAGERP